MEDRQIDDGDDAEESVRLQDSEEELGRFQAKSLTRIENEMGKTRAITVYAEDILKRSMRMFVICRAVSVYRALNFRASVCLLKY
uniref:t-SNARE coiled-coil homology domain-containing protein n=1 Tax=Syphacia muris TaxID=451379 RepID=A0A0N5AB98_9BILA